MFWISFCGSLWIFRAYVLVLLGFFQSSTEWDPEHGDVHHTGVPPVSDDSQRWPVLLFSHYEEKLLYVPLSPQKLADSFYAYD